MNKCSKCQDDLKESWGITINKLCEPCSNNKPPQIKPGSFLDSCGYKSVDEIPTVKLGRHAASRKQSISEYFSKEVFKQLGIDLGVDGVLIENWSLVHPSWKGIRRDPFPEEFIRKQKEFCLHGKVYNHPRIEDGHRAITSWVVSFENERVKTESGTTYVLGSINQQYLEWLLK